MVIIKKQMFTFPLTDDASLILRTPAIAEAYYELLVANHERLAQWEPWLGQAPTLEGTRTFLEKACHNWLDGSELPVAIAIREEDNWQLVGSVELHINRYTRIGEIGCWIDAAYEGHGLATKAVAAILDEAFGPLGLDRVALHIVADNERSRAVARRLGFVEEGTLRKGAAFPAERHDEIIYGLLAAEWRNSTISS
jgi:ribosomal-protein-serine acetyltransferase